VHSMKWNPRHNIAAQAARRLVWFPRGRGRGGGWGFALEQEVIRRGIAGTPDTRFLSDAVRSLLFFPVPLWYNPHPQGVQSKARTAVRNLNRKRPEHCPGLLGVRSRMKSPQLIFIAKSGLFYFSIIP
jgi:hypothetical protein